MAVRYAKTFNPRPQKAWLHSIGRLDSGKQCYIKQLLGEPHLAYHTAGCVLHPHGQRRHKDELSKVGLTPSRCSKWLLQQGQAGDKVFRVQHCSIFERCSGLVKIFRF